MRIGIIGGGQLCKMFIQHCSTLSLDISLYDSCSNCPARVLCNSYTQGSFMDYEKIVDFGKCCDILTYDREDINLEALKQLEHEGVKVYPSSTSLETIQDKNLQKVFLVKSSIPTSHFIYCKNNAEILFNILIKKVTFPCVWKQTKFGYDGFGVKVLRKTQDLDDLIDCECIIEKYVDIDKEISLIVARNKNGQVNTYSPIEMVFNDNTNQVEMVFQPANISNTINEKLKNEKYF